MDQHTSAAVDWLLSSDEPAIRSLARRDLLDEPADDPDLVLSGPKVSTLLAGQEADGGFGPNPYRKWSGVHWRLVSLAELDAPPADSRVAAAVERVLRWRAAGLAGQQSQTAVVDGLVRRCASVDGNALAACSRLGHAGDPRARLIAEALISWQWPDGGWNCDRRASGRRSSFHESLSTAWGLYEFGAATGHSAATAAAVRTAELFLSHRVFRRLRDGEVIDSRWLKLRYPSYWRYDLLQALLVLSRMGHAGDPRAGDALEELERKRAPDGRWSVEGRWWNPPGSATAVEAVDWGRSGPNEMITLNALRILRAGRRLG